MHDWGADNFGNPEAWLQFMLITARRTSSLQFDGVSLCKVFVDPRSVTEKSHAFLRLGEVDCHETIYRPLGPGSR
eukprot:scaffold53_cov381-Pavlova_lutheri.AAC.3